MQFIVTAYDFDDEDAIKRRLSNRQAHLSSIEKMVIAGTFLSGGAILNEHGKMIGSSVHVEFPSRAEVDAWIKQDPYTIGRVWNNVNISEGVLFPVSKVIKQTVDSLG
ncbi:YciI family protein [Colwellia psychrerythraea]|uniref:YCII-related protein n=1 Tax=Colwellia psychrerythraea TaxID=28229 RepID=A0A099KBJ3_COLPS|nr:YciI family protein [Colwellia psychrerythraea]KGJ87437.1 YCII-related protein [Colwellia psychrerythraea]